jgi:flagellar protein FliS
MLMDLKLRNFYLEAQIKNASPGQLLIMLYDGLLDNAERAETAISTIDTTCDPLEASHCVSRCINLMTELTVSLRPEEDPGLCTTLRNLYVFFTKEFSEAFDKRDPARIRAIVPLIRGLRDAWSEAYRRSAFAQVAVA